VVALGTPRPDLSAGQPDRFARLLHAEWTKLRTVRGWVVTILVAAALPTGFALLNMGQCTVTTGTGAGTGTSACPAAPTGPGGEAVTDQFSFVHRALAGDGSITVRVTSLTGLYSSSGGVSGGSAASGGLAPNPTAGWTPGIQPWSKAGIIITASTRPGSAYAAMLVTGSHGVRMQWNYTGDTAGLAGTATTASPRWLRLVRHGGTITGYDSADGTSWTKAGTVALAGLPDTAQAGLFATSPARSIVTSQSAFGGSGTFATSQDTGAFDHLSLGGTWPGGAWTGGDVGDTSGPSGLDGFRRAGAGFTVSGSGDIAPVVPGLSAGGGMRIEDAISVGSFAALIAVAVLGTLFITAEYRRGLIRLTLAASPRRGRVLAAKAIVIGAVTLAAGIAAIAVALPAGLAKLRSGGNPILPVTALTEVRVIAGAAALIAVASVLALAIGAVLRRGALAVTAVIAGIVLPYLLAITALPAGAGDWVLRITPAAAIAAEQSIPAYPQVTAAYTPMYGYFPLAPWAGFAVLCAWTAAALALAAFLLHRRDA
jgi:ABC-type transport system involved in multi-copper enzyme maturation permease subunit